MNMWENFHHALNSVDFPGMKDWEIFIRLHVDGQGEHHLVAVRSLKDVRENVQYPKMIRIEHRVPFTYEESFEPMFFELKILQMYAEFEMHEVFENFQWHETRLINPHFKMPDGHETNAYIYSGIRHVVNNKLRLEKRIIEAVEAAKNARKLSDIALDKQKRRLATPFGFAIQFFNLLRTSYRRLRSCAVAYRQVSRT